MVREEEEMSAKPSKGYRVFQVVNTIIMIIIIFITLYPLCILLHNRLVVMRQQVQDFVTFYPIDFNLDTYKYILKIISFSDIMQILFFITIVGNIYYQLL